MILAITISLLAGLTVLALVLGAIRLSKRYQHEEQQQAFLANLTRSEIEIEREEQNQVSSKSWTGYWYNFATRAGYRFDSPQIPGYAVIGVMVVAFAVGFFVWPRDIFGGLFIAVGGVAIARIYLGIAAGARIRKLEKQLPTLLQGIRANLNANSTNQQAILDQADNVPSPLGDELKLLRDDIDVNIPLDLALANFANRIPSREVKFLVAAIRISISSGSNLAPLVENIQNIVTKRQAVANMLASAVAQVQPALWVSGIFIPAGFLFSYYSDPQNQAYWTSFFGIITAVVIALLYATGLFISKKQVDRVKKA